MSSTYTWQNAVNACAAISGWRLPTISELQSYWSAGGPFNSSSYDYWSSTEYGATYAYSLASGNGGQYGLNKTSNFRVICVSP